MTTIHMPLSELYSHWDRLRNVPVKASARGAVRIDEDFLHFKRGTPTEQIWRWFELQNPNFIAGEVMEGIRRTDTTAVAAEIIHLSETGMFAGRRFCQSDGSDGARSVHAIYAPLGNPSFRSKLCDKCLTIWATEAYSDGDPMPEYIEAARARAQSAGQAGGTKSLAGETRPQLELQ